MGGLPVAHIFKRRHTLSPAVRCLVFRKGNVMKNRLSGIKNLLWAAAILLCLLAMLVGLVFSMSQKRHGEVQSGTITLGKIDRTKKNADTLPGADNTAERTLIALPDSPKAGLDAVFGMTFLCDKTILGLKTYAEHYGDGAAVQIWTDPDGGGMRAAEADETKIVFVDGSLVTPHDAAMITRTKKIVIYLGGDGLAETTEKDFIDGYTRLIESLREASPDIQITVCSIASVSSNYQGADGLNPQLVARANTWIRQVCINTGVYYADLAAFLNDENGYLSDSYLMPDGRSIAAAGIALVVDYFRFHGVS